MRGNGTEWADDALERGPGEGTSSTNTEPSSDHWARSRARPRASVLWRSRVHWATSESTLSRIESERSLRRTASSRFEGGTDASVSRSGTQPAELFTLRTAATRSFQSERLTNSKRASLTLTPSASWFDEPARRLCDGEVGGEKEMELSGSTAGVDDDCLNSWRESATLRPIPVALWLGEWLGEWGVSEELEEDDEADE